ncbi:MAG: efflux RND transporter permease subunit [Bacteroidetes bacterium]|nr:efflux RND transporter permease subunit [Bacteroidota bacterium]
MASIVDTSINRPLLIIVVFAAITLGGFLSYNALNLNLMPKFELPMVTIQTIYPGAGASEVETSVTKIIEDALSTLENLKKISSTSVEGASVVIVTLNEDADANLGVQEAQRKISAVKLKLPTDILEPSINKIDLEAMPVMNLAASSSLPPTEFYKLVEDRIQPRLAKLPGVGAVDISGGTSREIQVNVNAEKLKAYNLSILQVLQAIQTANMEIPAGNIENTEATYSVRLSAKFSSLKEISNTVITTLPNGGKIKVLDVAEVVDGIAEQKLISRIDGKDAIGLSIQKQSDANTVKITDLAKAELAAIEQEYAKDNVKFEIAKDDSIYTRASANAVIIDLLLAILIVTLVCLVFLHNLRSAMIVMLAVPLSIIPSFIAMYLLGYSLNLMSLMALSLVVGILVDDSIVVIENMFRHLEMGKNKRRAAIDGCKQIMFTVMAITIVIVVVFMPLAVTGGMIGNVLKEFAFPIMIATCCSLLVSFTISPLLMSRIAKLSDNTRPTFFASISRTIEHIFDSLQNLYAKVLAVSLRRKVVVFIVTLTLVVSSFALIPVGFIGFEFMPESDQGEFVVSLDMNPQISLYQNNQITLLAEKIISSKPEVERVYTNVGSSGTGMGTSTKSSATTITAKMVDKNKRNKSSSECAEEVKYEIMRDIPGIRARAAASTMAGPPGASIQLIVQGSDFSKVEETAATLLNIVLKTPGTIDAKYSTDDPKQEVMVNLDREKMATLGLSVYDVGATLRTALNGNDDSKYREGNYEYDIRIGVDNFDRTKIEDVARLTFMNRSGQLIELNQIADIIYGLGPSALQRNDRISSITVQSSVVGRPTGTVGAEIMAAIKGKVPEGVEIKESGMLEMQGDTFGNLAIAFIAAIVLIYFIMVILYNSLLDPIIVLFSIPLALVGAFLALALTMNNLTLFTIIGLIVLIGLVAKNAILLVDFANHMRRDKNMNISDALIEAGRERLRPILMTTFAMIFGMLPIALASGNAAEIKNGMAWVIIGGLTSSMVLTLIVVPVVYYIFHTILLRYQTYSRTKLVKKAKARMVTAEG